MPQSVTTPVADDASLALRFSGGDVAAFRELHGYYADRLRAFVGSRCRRELDADDLCQEIWLRAWSRRSQFDGRHFSGWIFKIAHRLICDAYRKQLPSEMPEDFDPLAVVQQGLEVELTALRDCLQSVGGDFVKVVRMQLDGHDVPAIARELGIQPATVYTRVDRAKKQLGECVSRKLS